MRSQLGTSDTNKAADFIAELITGCNDRQLKEKVRVAYNAYRSAGVHGSGVAEATATFFELAKKAMNHGDDWRALTERGTRAGRGPIAQGSVCAKDRESAVRGGDDGEGHSLRTCEEPTSEIPGDGVAGALFESEGDGAARRDMMTEADRFYIRAMQRRGRSIDAAMLNQSTLATELALRLYLKPIEVIERAMMIRRARRSGESIESIAHRWRMSTIKVRTYLSGNAIDFALDQHEEQTGKTLELALDDPEEPTEAPPAQWKKSKPWRQDGPTIGA